MSLLKPFEGVVISLRSMDESAINASVNFVSVPCAGRCARRRAGMNWLVLSISLPPGERWPKLQHEFYPTKDVYFLIGDPAICRVSPFSSVRNRTANTFVYLDPTRNRLLVNKLDYSNYCSTSSRPFSICSAERLILNLISSCVCHRWFFYVPLTVASRGG
jgi:hypothetical protein